MSLLLWPIRFQFFDGAMLEEVQNIVNGTLVQITVENESHRISDHHPLWADS